MDKCRVCFQSFNIDMQVIRCPQCHNSLHKDHLPELVDEHTKCPICKQKFSSSSLVRDYFKFQLLPGFAFIIFVIIIMLIAWI